MLSVESVWPSICPRGTPLLWSIVFFDPVGDADFSSVEEAHAAIVDQVVEVDEELMTVYLDQGEVSPDQLHDPFEQAMREGHLVPVCFLSAETGAGVTELLEVIIR